MPTKNPGTRRFCCHSSRRSTKPDNERGPIPASLYGHRRCVDASLPRRRPTSSPATSAPDWPRPCCPRTTTSRRRRSYAVVTAPPATASSGLRLGSRALWAKDLSIGNRMINARAETVADSKRAFSTAQRKRVHRLVDGFYEWERQGEKRSSRIRRQPGHDAVRVAGLWERGRPPDRQADQPSTPARSSRRRRTQMVAPTARPHAGHPPREQVGRVALPEERRRRLIAGLARPPAPGYLLTMHPVSTDVNNVRNKGSHLIQPADPA